MSRFGVGTDADGERERDSERGRGIEREREREGERVSERKRALKKSCYAVTKIDNTNCLKKS